MVTPEDIQMIGEEIAIRWTDGREDYYPMELLRACSPSAENIGEKDIFGRIHGGDPRTEYPGVRVEHWDFIGNYAVRFFFSDKHKTGLYSYEYLLRLGDQLKENA